MAKIDDIKLVRAFVTQAHTVITKQSTLTANHNRKSQTSNYSVAIFDLTDENTICGYLVSFVDLRSQ